MESTILVIPDRPGCQTTLDAALESYIQRNYKQNSAPHIGDCQELDEMRRNAIDAVNDKDADIGPMLIYFSQLIQLSCKFPDDICTFDWKSSLGYGSGTVQSKLLWFDAINVLYNIAARYTQQAAKSSDDKVAYQKFQLAAGAFDQVLNCTQQLVTAPPLGLDEPTLGFLKLLCIAQAQECFWAKQRQENKGGNSLSAKLASGVANVYTKCLAMAVKTAVIRAEWHNHIEAKIILFEAIAQYRQCLHCLEKGQYGEQVARLQRAEKILSAPLGDYTDNTVRAQIANLKSRVTSDCRNAEKENDLLYLQAVPNNPEAPKPLDTANPTNLTLPTPKALFTLLLPFAVYQAPAAYSQRLNKYVSDFVFEELEKMNNKTEETFGELGLPAALEMVHQPDVVPTSLLRESETVQTVGGTQYSQSYLEQNLKLANAANERLAALPPSEEVNSLKGYVATATKSDTVVQEQINSSKYLVGILNGGHAAIEAFLPRGEMQDSDSDLKIKAKQVHQIVDQLELLAARRNDRIRMYQSKLKTIDFTTPTHEFIAKSSEPISEPHQLEPVFNNIASQFDSEIRDIENEKLQLGTLLSTLKQRFATFSARAADITSHSIERQQAVNALQGAAHQYRTITSNLKEGREFYNALLGKISALEARPVPGQWAPDEPIKFG